MNKCLVSGSYDPITKGHLDIINRASKIFDNVIVGVFNNENKGYMFELTQRVKLCKIATSNMDNVQVIGDSGMLFEFCKRNDITHIVRGFRDNKDYAYETEMAVFNFKHCGVQTYLLPADDYFDSISSSKVRDLLKNTDNQNDEIRKYINDEVLLEIRRIKNA